MTVMREDTFKEVMSVSMRLNGFSVHGAERRRWNLEQLSSNLGRPLCCISTRKFRRSSTSSVVG